MKIISFILLASITTSFSAPTKENEGAKYVTKIKEFEEKILKPLEQKCSHQNNGNGMKNSAKESKKKLCSTVEELKKIVGHVHAHSKVDNLRPICSQIRAQILLEDAKYLQWHYRDLVKDEEVAKELMNSVLHAWNEGAQEAKKSGRYNEKRRQNLNEHFMKLVAEMEKGPSKRTAFELMYTAELMGKEANMNSEMELEWALQQFAADLMVYKMEIEQMVEGVVGKWPIGMEA